jgi:hypothetical protein
MAITHLAVHIAPLADAAAPPRAPRTDTVARRFDAALLLAEHGRWPQAFDALRGLANDGHPAAARMTLMLVRRGSVLFGGSFNATPQEQRRWQHVGQ